MTINVSSSFTRVIGGPSLAKVYHEPSAELYVGKLLVTGSVEVTGSVRVAGAITASSITVQTLVVTTISSSVEYVSGSTIHGSLSSNTHQFTGSILASGSIGIGTTSPVVNLDIVSGSNVASIPTVAGTGTLLRLSNSDNLPNAIESVAYNGTGLALRARFAGGTRATPSATPADSPFVAINGYGYDTAFGTVGKIQYRQSADSTWSATNNGTYHAWSGTTSGSTSIGEWMRLWRGRLGVLTGQPETELHVVGTGQFQHLSALGQLGSAVSLKFRNYDGTAYNASQLAVYDSGNNLTAGISFRNTEHGVSGSSDITVGVRNAGTMVYPMYISPTGNTGVGTFSPAAKLHVSGSVRLAGDDFVTDLANRPPYVDLGTSMLRAQSIYMAPVRSKNMFIGMGLVYDAVSGTTIEFATSQSYTYGGMFGFSGDTGTLTYSSTRVSGSNGDAVIPSASLAIDKDGNVGIGTSSPGANFDVSGSYGSIRGKYITANGSLAAYNSTTGGIYMHYNAGIGRVRSVADNSGTAAPFVLEIGNGLNAILVQTTRTVQFSAYGAGTLVTDSSGNITATSDARVKDISGSFDRGLDAITNLSPKVYHWSSGSGLNTDDINVGLIAQEVLPYIPEAVGYKDDKYTMSDRPIIAALINAVKELKVDNDDLRQRIASLEAK